MSSKINVTINEEVKEIEKYLDIIMSKIDKLDADSPKTTLAKALVKRNIMEIKIALGTAKLSFEVLSLLPKLEK